MLQSWTGKSREAHLSSLAEQRPESGQSEAKIVGGGEFCLVKIWSKLQAGLFRPSTFRPPSSEVDVEAVELRGRLGVDEVAAVNTFR